MIYLATGLEPTDNALQGIEEQHMTVERIALDDVPDLVGRGELTDAKSIIGLTLTLRRLGRYTDPVVSFTPLEVEEFLTWLAAERGRAANTVAAYRRDLDRVRGVAVQRRPVLDEVTEDDLDAYVHRLRDSGKAPASVARALVVVRSLHRFLVDEGMAPHRPGRRARATAGAQRSAQAADRGAGDDADRVGGRRRRAGAAATVPSSRCSTGRACGSPSWSGCRSRTSISTDRSCGRSARARRSGWCRSAAWPRRR